ncbi:biotin synthase BioB [Neolewinella agarilytica]|uniref:Biotin synthase n=1 Tax=Neolewinella agarilytica TaxID=478744 RepID=A0A1H8YYL2_9BACT|nr:biotin synthase BioB [Neolewinella agarilytica]SEP57173.1 biotin synthase [Neolewinella agarilytica]
MTVKTDPILRRWTLDEVRDLYQQPMMDLVFRAASVHREHHDPNEVQMSSLLSIKTGGCPEDCGYCPQAARYHTDIEENALMTVEQVKTAAERAKGLGSSRLCMGAAWRNVRDDEEFEQVLDLVRTVNGLDMEVCATLGMLTPNQAERLAAAGLYAYNHNLDSSEEYYKEVISTRGYQDRLDTIGNARKAGLTVCSGGIIGMGESIDDRLKMLLTLASLTPQPESVPINALVAVEGTPLEDQQQVNIFEMVRMIAVTRIVMPNCTVRLSAGRTTMSPEGQALCFLAGAGSIFAGDKLLTTPNPEAFEDLEMFNALGLRPTAPYAKGEKPAITEDPGAPGEKTRIKWSRPGHKIERNEAKRK